MGTASMLARVIGAVDPSFPAFCGGLGGLLCGGAEDVLRGAKDLLVFWYLQGLQEGCGIFWKVCLLCDYIYRVRMLSSCRSRRKEGSEVVYIVICLPPRWCFLKPS